MTRKKIDMSPRPKQATATADAWVRDRSRAGAEPSKRLTIDIPASLHARVKAGCALRGTNMKKVVLELLEQAFEEKASQ